MGQQLLGRPRLGQVLLGQVLLGQVMEDTDLDIDAHPGGQNTPRHLRVPHFPKIRNNTNHLCNE